MYIKFRYDTLLSQFKPSLICITNFNALTALLSSILKNKKYPQFRPSAGASKIGARKLRIYRHGIVVYDPIYMSAMFHAIITSIKGDKKGGHNRPPLRFLTALKAQAN